MTDQQRSEDSTSTSTSTVFAQAQDGEAGEVARTGLYPTQDSEDAREAAADCGAGSEPTTSSDDDPELEGADWPEDQADGQGPTIAPGA